jgi:hypothetical protein
VNALLLDSSVTPSQIYAGTDVGIFVSSTTAASWTEAGPAPGPGVSGYLPDAPVTALQMFNPDAGTKMLVASTYGRGIWNYALAASPNYANVISNSPHTVFPAQTATFNGTLTAKGGYASPVNLSCSGAMPATCTLQPTQITPTATYTLTAAGVVGDYSFNAHAVGTDGNAITRDASVTLHVVDFNLTAPSPNSMSVAQGGASGASSFQVTATGSFAGTVTLSCSAGLPSGAACSFSPSSSVNPTSSAPVTVTLTVTAGTGTPLGGPKLVTLAAMVAGAPAAKTQTFTLTVTGPTPDFAIAVTSTPNATVANQNVTWNGTLTAVNGYSGSVHLTCAAGAPTTCGIVPATLTPTSGGAGFAVTLGNATTGAFNFTIQGTDGTLTHATPTKSLTVGTDVTWTDTGGTTGTVLAGQSATYTFSAVAVGGTAFSSAVSFACSGVPALASCGFIPTTIAAGAGTTPVTLTISTAGPNAAKASRPRAGAVLRTVWTAGGGRSYALMFLAMVGIGGLAGKRRGKPRLYARIVVICLGLVVMAEISCGGAVGGGGGPPPPVTVTMSPGSATLFANEGGNSWPASVTQKQFMATVNSSTNQTVTWAVTPGSGNGTVDATGLYTAPAAVPNPVTVTATAAADTTKSGSATVTVLAPSGLGTSQITVTATAVGGALHGDVVTLIVQ